MQQAIDYVEEYGRSVGLALRPRTVIVEGTSDVDLFRLASRLASTGPGEDLIGGAFGVVAAGWGDDGGTRGVIRQLVVLRELSKTCLLPNGKPKYRFVGLLDNDDAGKRAVKFMGQFDVSLLEYKDVFRLRPRMPRPGNLTPEVVRNSFERENAAYTDLDWEVEDLLSERFVSVFIAENPTYLKFCRKVNDRVHYEWTRDGKARLHRFVKENAMRGDVAEVIDLLRLLRYYMAVH